MAAVAASSSTHACSPVTPHARACFCGAQEAQRKVLDVINSVGLGDSVLRMIERRHRGDLYLALGGMVRRPCGCSVARHARWRQAAVRLHAVQQR